MEWQMERDSGFPHFFGRTLYDPLLRGMFFNWTGSGFALAFEGTRVEIEATAFADDYPGEDENLPWLAVLLDGDREPTRLVKAEKGAHRLALYESEAPQRHVLHVVKRSENSKGRVCVHRLFVEGKALPFTPEEPRYRLEFIGDSITCGFGGDMPGDSPVFSTALENGLRSYAAVTAELLGAQYHSLCISGIPLCWASDPAYRLRLPQFPDFETSARSMETHYEYTDRFHQEAQGMAHGFEKWDFDRFRPDAIVINLGTNDAFRIRVSGNDPAEEAHFVQRYRAFLPLLRRLNGPRPVIACTLGSMDYFLFDAIEKAVAAYQKETGDQRVFCMKFGAIDPWGEGFGGLGHPNAKTHARMGRELASALKPWLGWKEEKRNG